MKVLHDRQGSAESQLSRQLSCDLADNHPPDAPVLDSSSVSVSSNKSRKITREHIEIVQNLVERCLQLYMNREEVVNTLLYRARIEPGFTTLVWQKLEEQNPDFFKAYYTRLKLKEQIILFNQLLGQQYSLMNGGSSLDHGECADGDISMGYPVAQYSPQMDFSGSISASHVANGIPTPNNFHAMVVNSNENMDASMTSGERYPFTSDISGLSADMSALDSTFSCHMTSSDGLQPGHGDGKQSLQSFAQMPWNLSFSHLTADLINMEVEEFFADTVPEAEIPSEEEISSDTEHRAKSRSLIH